ncbi:hypothetical protein K504DRAFT_236472 [Pleomassaria siparia CBS 279.74]|uniref:Uncharacterized protein n=1 Tax=Pleomassaria siparia CBS 279.74 TaxID=1314801 RepID=A0A6G1KEB6_9PLEO|nr:hypothetical protein K504DRAFT_236472 [Pleomassaria siparia CBS 279.74]
MCNGNGARRVGADELLCSALLSLSLYMCDDGLHSIHSLSIKEFKHEREREREGGRERAMDGLVGITCNRGGETRVVSSQHVARLKIDLLAAKRGQPTTPQPTTRAIDQTRNNLPPRYHHPRKPQQRQHTSRHHHHHHHPPSPHPAPILRLDKVAVRYSTYFCRVRGPGPGRNDRLLRPQHSCDPKAEVTQSLPSLAPGEAQLRALRPVLAP